MLSHDKRKLDDDKNGNASEQPAKKQCQETCLLRADVSERVAYADDLVAQSNVKKQRDVYNMRILGRMQDKVDGTSSLADQSKVIMDLLSQDSKLTEPMLDLGYTLSNGSLLLTKFVEFVAKCCCVDSNTRSIIKSFSSLLHTLLTRKKPSSMIKPHEEEQKALVLFTSRCNSTYGKSTPIDIAKALIERGACIHARCPKGYASIHYWSKSPRVQSARGIIALLEAGADLSMLNARSRSALWFLCMNARVDVIRDLILKGWLDTVNLDAFDTHVETPMMYLQKQLASNGEVADPTRPNADVVMREIYELLHNQQQRWKSTGRTCVSALLSAHEQLVPDLAQVIISYM